MNRKAITPLISTILLLSFAIGLGTLVMSWGTSESSKEMSCEDVSISITDLNSSKQICMEGTELKAVLENNGNVVINRLEVIMLTSDSVMTKEFEVNMVPMEFKHVSFSIETANISKILKIRMIPIINSKSCIQQRFEIERIEKCS